MFRPDFHSDWLLATGMPAQVAGLMSTRAGGISPEPWTGLNLRPPQLPGVDLDEPQRVVFNQARYAQALQGAVPVYLDQVHGAEVVQLTRALALEQHAAGWVHSAPLPRADASVTTEQGVACTVLVADCLPVLFSAPDGRAVGAAHAGWRGLAGGVLEATLARVVELAGCSSETVHAWLGACIGPTRFEVGDEVREAFGDQARGHFQPSGRAGHWLADLPGLARWRLSQAGVQVISGGRWCTVSDASRFFSYRRDRVTGRHAASIWIR